MKQFSISGWIAGLASVSFAILFFSYLFGFNLIHPSNVAWLLDRDGALQLFGANFFAHEPWQWPPGKIVSYAYPWGTSVPFAEVPWLAFIAKSLQPEGIFQSVGLWVFGCIVLQALCGYWLATMASVNKFNAVCGSLLFLSFPAFLFRIFENTRHYALAAHFVILICVAVATLDIRNKKVTRSFWIIFLLSMFGVFFYFTLMVFFFWLLVEVCHEPKNIGQWKEFFITRKLQVFGLGLGTFVLMYLLGYLVVSPGKSIQEGGFGSFTMNLLSFANSEGFSSFFPKIPTRSYEQREGVIYLGAGIFWLLAVVGFNSEHRQKILVDFKRVPLFALCLGVFVLFLALSPRITLASLTIPDGIGVAVYFLIFYQMLKDRFGKKAFLLAAATICIYLFLGNTYRSSGRFAWILGYSLLFYLLHFDFKKWVLPVAVVLQVVDLYPLASALRSETLTITQAGQKIIQQSTEWDFLKSVKQIKIIDPMNLDRVPIGYFAMLNHTPIGPMYRARRDKIGEEEFNEENRKRIAAGELEPGVLYILGDPAVVSGRPEIKVQTLSGYTFIQLNSD